MLKLGGRVTRDETIVSAALVKKFWQVSVQYSTTRSSGTYLDDLVDLVVLARIRHGILLGAGCHVVGRVVHAAVTRGVGVEVVVGGGAMPLVVGACGVGLEVAGGRGCAR